MEEPADAKPKAVSSDGNEIYVSSEEDGSNSDVGSGSPESSGDKSEAKGDQAEKPKEKAEASTTAEKKNKKFNKWKKGNKNMKKEQKGAEQGTKNVSPEKTSQGDKKKDDPKKQTQQKKESGLVPDKGGMYSLWVKKPYPGYTHEEAYRTFVLFGDVAEINFLEQNFFVKYFTKEAAQTAMKRLKGVLGVEPAHVKNVGKSVHGSYQSHYPQTQGTIFRDSTPRPTEVYIGNISLNSDKREIENFLEGTKFTNLRLHNKNGKGFAFVMFPNLHLAEKVVRTMNGKVLQGRALMVRMSDNGSGQQQMGDGLSLLGHYNMSQSSHSSHSPHSPPEGIAVIVKNLHPETKENHLYTLFSRYGGAAYVETKFVSNKNCVEAMVELHSDWFAQAAIKELQGQIVDGRMLTISYSNADPHSGAGHHGGGHHGNGHHGNGHHGSGHHHGRGHHGSHGRHGNMQGNMHLNNRSFHGPASPHPHPVINKLQQATDLAHRVDALVDEVLDDCHYCERIKTLMSELQYALLEVSQEVGH